MIQFTIEIQIANSALDEHLPDLEKHQEWQNYLAASKLHGKKVNNVVSLLGPNLTDGSSL